MNPSKPSYSGYAPPAPKKEKKVEKARDCQRTLGSAPASPSASVPPRPRPNLLLPRSRTFRRLQKRPERLLPPVSPLRPLLSRRQFSPLPVRLEFQDNKNRPSYGLVDDTLRIEIEETLVHDDCGIRDPSFLIVVDVDNIRIQPSFIGVNGVHRVAQVPVGGLSYPHDVRSQNWS